MDQAVGTAVGPSGVRPDGPATDDPLDGTGDGEGRDTLAHALGQTACMPHHS